MYRSENPAALSRARAVEVKIRRSPCCCLDVGFAVPATKARYRFGETRIAFATPRILSPTHDRARLRLRLTITP
jgi:hypothetical protein